MSLTPRALVALARRTVVSRSALKTFSKVRFSTAPEEVVKEYLDNSAVNTNIERSCEFVKEDQTEPWHKMVHWMDRTEVLDHLFEEHDHMVAVSFAVHGPDGSSDMEWKGHPDQVRRIIEEGGALRAEKTQESVHHTRDVLRRAFLRYTK